MLTIWDGEINNSAIKFCEDFMKAEPESRYLFGRNEYAEGIANLVSIGAFIDDFTEETRYLGKPIIKKEDIARDGLVVATLLGKPLTAKKVLSDARVRHLDYFSFFKYCGLDMPPVRFWGLFEEDFKNNKDKYIWIEGLLSDEESKKVYSKIVNFRLSADLAYMEGFTDRQKEQYFEGFLDLKQKDEVFVDVGGFDGYTSMEFIKRCPDYRSVYIFEPEAGNMEAAKKRLSGFENVIFVQQGVAEKKDIVKFSKGGSISSINEDGDIEITVDALDNVISDNVTFIKMDVEGAEGLAIEGARQTILMNHPRMAISVYHKFDDLWKIPEQILSIRKDYNIYLRHYTEGVVETVMFFTPKK